MALTISSNAQMVGSLFSSMHSNRTSNFGSSPFASTDLLGISYMDYSSIKSGSYFKLLDAYYSLNESGDTTEKTATTKKNPFTTSTATDSASKLADIEDKAEKMTKVADSLITAGNKSLFKETTKMDEEGNVTTGYDTDKIYQAVKNFADQYNSLVNSAENSNVKQIANAVTSMSNSTVQNEKLLSAVGITIDEETKDMKVDEATFKKANMNTVKTVFNGTGSYAYQTAVKASMIDYYAQNEASKANTYNNTGKYSYNYSSGSIWNSVI